MSLKYRTFTAQFKREIVEQILFRSIPVGQLSREHNITRQILYRWVKKYQQGQISRPVGRPSSSPKAQVKDLETLVGRLMIDNELLKKALKVIQEQPKSNEIISGSTEISLDQ